MYGHAWMALSRFAISQVRYFTSKATEATGPTSGAASTKRSQLIRKARREGLDDEHYLNLYKVKKQKAKKERDKYQTRFNLIPRNLL